MCRILSLTIVSILASLTVCQAGTIAPELQAAMDEAGRDDLLSCGFTMQSQFDLARKMLLLK